MDYVPILKWKAGEQTALSNLRPADRSRLCPVLEVIQGAVQGKQQIDGLVPDTSGMLVKDIITAWGDSPVFVDLSPLEADWRPASGRHPVEHFFDEARHVGQRWIPVVPMQRDAAYQAAAASATAAGKRGVCIRVRFDDVVDESFATELEGLRAALRVDRGEVDLLIDAGALGANNITVLRVAARGAVASIPQLQTWRSVIFAATSFPDSLSVQPMGASTIVREEWRIWRHLRAVAENTRPVVFADYTAAGTAVPAGQFVGSANVRYTIDDEWLIFRGWKLTDDAHGGHEQFRVFAEQLVNDSRFCGASFSWGDQQIEACAQRKSGPGNPTTWRAVATSHHLAHVLHQLGTLAAAGS